MSVLKACAIDGYSSANCLLLVNFDSLLCKRTSKHLESFPAVTLSSQASDLWASVVEPGHK